MGMGGIFYVGGLVGSGDGVGINRQRGGWW